MTPELSIVIPAYNEAETVGGVIEGHRSVAARIAREFEIIVCDDGSTDGTAAALAEARDAIPQLTVLSNERNLGIPATMKRLYREARGEWIYFGPADGQVPSSALEVMWAAREGAALVVGRRIPRRDPLSRVLIAELYSVGLRAVFRLPVRDIDSVKLYRASDLHAVRIRSESNFFEAEILISLCRAHRIVREVVVGHRPRIAGRAKGVTPRAVLLAAYELSSFMLNDLAHTWSR